MHSRDQIEYHLYTLAEDSGNDVTFKHSAVVSTNEISRFPLSYKGWKL